MKGLDPDPSRPPRTPSPATMRTPLRHTSTRNRRTRRGFSLLELVIVLGLIAALAGVVALQSGKYIQRGQVSAIVQLAKNLKTAAATFYADTGKYPREYDMAKYSGKNRELSLEQSLVGWDGPYLEEGLTANSDNPFGAIHLYDTSVAAGNKGFDLDGDGSNEITKDVCMLYLGGIPEEVAQRLDAHYDEGVGGTWNETGVFNWKSSNSRGYILIFK